MIRSLPLPAALALSGALVLANPTAAQAPSAVPAFGPSRTPDADALILAMRRLADAPRDVEALLTAAELSLKVGDVSGAAALFKRAEGVEPMNGRVRAGMARILVTQERPGEALRYFDQAIGFGLDPKSFAGDRGLAYDLIGEGERAQRDYRLALKQDDSDEVRRRYALSLAIAGKQLAALEQIEPLTRRGDRAAWRARAFILAMTGDLPGATAIVTRSMPETLAQGLAPFLQRLGALPAADKAFAVHFGELHATPARIADARLTPALPVLGPDPDARVQVAVALPTLERGKRGRRQRERRARERRVEVASVPATRGSPAAAAAASRAPAAPAPQPPDQLAANVARPPAPTAARTGPVRAAPTTPAYTPMRIDPFQKATLADYAQVRRYNREMEARLARNAARRAATPVPSAAAPLTAGAAASPVVAATAPTPPAMAAPPRPAAPIVVQVAAPAPAVSLALGGTPPASIGPVSAVPQESAPAVQLAAASSAIPTAPDASERTIVARLSSGQPPAPRSSTPQPESPVSVQPAPVRVARERPPVTTPPVDARPARRPAPAPALAAEQSGSRRRTAAGRPRDEVAANTPAPRRAAGARTRATEPAEAAPTRTRGARRGAADEDAAPTRRGARARDEAEVAAADTRRGSRRPAAKDDAPTAKGKAARAEKPDKAEPARIWVQVAGGANADDLPKAWSAVQGRSAALKGRQAYSTPLRATNRVVTGPFKTDAEARAFVNTLSKQGVSAFPFTSDKGQKMAKLPPK